MGSGPSKPLPQDSFSHRHHFPCPADPDDPGIGVYPLDYIHMVPVFGSNNHAGQVIQALLEHKNSDGVFGTFVFGPYHQPISASHTNQVIYEQFNLCHWSIGPINPPSRLDPPYPLARLFELESDQFPVPYRLKSAVNDENNSDISSAPIVIEDEIPPIIPFLRLSYPSSYRYQTYNGFATVFEVAEKFTHPWYAHSSAFHNPDQLAPQKILPLLLRPNLPHSPPIQPEDYFWSASQYNKSTGIRSGDRRHDTSTMKTSAMGSLNLMADNIPAKLRKPIPQPDPIPLWKSYPFNGIISTMA